MSKKRKIPRETYSSSTPSIEDPDLKSKAVDQLVEAHHGDDSGVNEKEVKAAKKKRNWFARIPVWVKAPIFKWWFAAATCFFFLWGLGGYTKDQWAVILILGLANGVITDLLTNNFLRLFETWEKEYDVFILVTPRKKFWTLFVNVAYGLAITLLVVYTYQGINELLIAANPGKYGDTIPLPVEPLLFGLFYFVYDMIPIGIKDLIVMLKKRSRNAVDE